MRVHEDVLELKPGVEGIYGYVERVDGVFVAILNEKDEILLIKQYRYPIDKYEWSIPGGASDGGGRLEEEARREVYEETGIKLGELEKLGLFYPLSSCSTEAEHLFLARGDYAIDSQEVTGEADEEIVERRFVSMKQAVEMIDRGEISDPFSSTAIQMVARRLSLL